MSRVRRAPKQLRSSVKIHILCEGETEEAHLGKILSSYRNVSIECFGGGGYGRAESEFDRNSPLYSVILIVMDLDKAQQKTANRRLLNHLIDKIQRNDKRHCLFLTAPDIEYWVACCINKPDKYRLEDLESMGYRKGSAVIDFLRQQHGSYENALAIVNSTNVYYCKPYPGANVSLKPEYLMHNQSNLASLINYINLLNQ